MRTIQRFEILAVLGDGGMGTVYRARDPQLEREVAIKILHDATSGVRSALNTEHTLDLRGRGGPRRRDDLLQEARMMARLSHPNVVPIYEVGLDERGDVFVVMEYVAGEDLRAWLHTARTPDELARVFAQAARGLAAAHERGIVHRDFKPDNVLIGVDGRARVGDFGISKLAEPTGLVMTAKVAGTPKYMAPELWRGEPATPASDVFALCTTIVDAYGAHAVPAVIARGLEKRPQDRPAVGELIAALEGHPPRRPARLVAAVVLGGAAIGTSVAFAMHTDEATPCADVVGAHWTTATRDALRASLGADTRVLAIFDRRAAEIATLSRAACRGSGTERTEAQTARQQRCLEVRAVELAAVAARQVRAGTDPIAAEIRFNRMSLPASCATLAMTAPDPAALAPLYARYYDLTDLPPTAGLDALPPLAAAARAAGDPELAVRSAILLGARQRNTDQANASDDTLHRAYTEAAAIASTEAVTSALGERLLTLGNSRDVAQTKMLGSLALDAANQPTTTLRTRLRLLRGIGRTTAARGAHREAIELTREALALSAAADERNRDVEMLLLHDLAEAMFLANDRISEGVALAREAVAIGKQLGEHTNNYAVMLNLLAKGLMLQGDLEGSLAHRRRALAVWSSAFAPTHSYVIEGRVELGVSLMRASRFEEARRELAEAVPLAAKTDALARSYPWFLSRLALVTAELGRFDEAVRLQREAIERLTAAVGTDHPQTLDQRIIYGALQLELGRVDEAARIVDVLEHGFARGAQPGDRRPALTRGWLAADVELARNQPARAEALARRAVAELLELDSDEELAIVRRRLADALVAQQRYAEAEPVIEAALAAARAQHRREDEIAGYELTLAAVEHGLGDRAAARARAERIAPILARYPLQRTARARLARLSAGELRRE